MASAFQNLEASSQQTADRLAGIDSTAPLQVADYSGPLTPLDTGGVTLTAGSDTVIAPVAAGRVYIEVRHAGADGTGIVWLGFSAAAVANVGLFLKPGEGYYGFVAGNVHGRYVGSGSVLVTYQGWGA